tara:strand:+ start:613 stop:1443 length:831 start_codon:yes stop_codon:yes gene_type:complete
MSSYFPIPPTIWVEECSKNIYGSTTFLNIPNNRLSENFLSKTYQDVVFLGVYCLKNNKWFLLKSYKCNPFEFIEFKRVDFSVGNYEILVIIPNKINKFPRESEQLPKPSPLRIDNSPVAERASLNFYLENSKTSYQGEYPFKMACLKNSSFLSFDSLKSNQDSNSVDFFIFMNITSAPSSEQVQIEVFDPQNKKNIRCLDAKRNSFNIYKIANLEADFPNKNTLFYKCKNCSFIPIMLSIDTNNYQLSVEHTHPPTELFIGMRKMEAVKLIKRRWT